MDNKQFTTLLANIRKTGQALDALIVQGIEYCSTQTAVFGNKDKWSRLTAACPVYARPVIRKAQAAAEAAAKRANQTTQQGTTAREAAVAGAVTKATREAKKSLAERRTKKAAKPAEPAAPAAPAAPAEPAKPAEVIEVEGDFVSLGGEIFLLTAEQAAVILDMLTSAEVRKAA